MGDVVAVNMATGCSQLKSGVMKRDAHAHGKSSSSNSSSSSSSGSSSVCVCECDRTERGKERKIMKKVW